ncbi:MAG: nucleotide sugar dehydrogenase [Novosphingobium sp.]
MLATNTHYQSLSTAIANREAHVCTVGLGYVGLPLALSIAEAGFPVTGFDVNVARVSRINAGERVISYFAENRIAEAVAGGGFGATSDPARLAEADVILICVPTPLTPERTPDLAYVIRAGEEIARQLRPGQLIVLESTVWPGATRELLRPILERGGLVAGSDFFLGFSPEREDPGNAQFTTRSIPKLVGADDPRSLDLIESLYSCVVTRAVRVESTAAAEAAKLVENTFRNVNIALANELKVALGAMGVDVWEVIEAAATKPFGFMPFYPGPGIGGDCIPVSPAYLAWRATEVGSDMPIVRLARETNESEPLRLAARIVDALAERVVAPEQARLLLLGIAYKKDVEDTRESPALALLGGLEALGVTVDYHDPFFPELPMTRDHAAFAGRRSVTLDAGIGEYDAVVIATDHSGVDYAGIAAQARLVIDTRNALAKADILIDGDKLLKL